MLATTPNAYRSRGHLRVVWTLVVIAVLQFLVSADCFAQKTSSDRDTAWRQASEFISKGDADLVRGDTGAALTKYRSALDTFKRLSANEPGNRDLQRNLRLSHNKIGDIQKAQGDLGAALVSFAAAIKVDPKYAEAYKSRGAAYTAKGDFDLAIADYTKAIAIDPKDATYYYGRANTYEKKGDFDLAIADHTKAVEIQPKLGAYLRQLGLARFNKGDFKAAAADLLRSLELSDDSYVMLFRYLARQRAGENAVAELEANAGRLKDKKWPYAVIELYLGKRSPAATLDAAGKPDEKCEAQFYIGQWYVAKGDQAAAAAPLKVAVDTCPKTFIEYTGAVVELKRLKP